jgi:hypothetical protein
MPTMSPFLRKRSGDLPIEIRPRLEVDVRCHVCDAQVRAREVLWQGIHVCARYRCSGCGQEFVEDLPIGQAIFTPYRIAADGLLIGDDSAKEWFGAPLRDSLQSPSHDTPIGFKVEIRRPVKQIIVLNCIDFLYGHCLLKLLNAQAHQGDAGPGLVVLVPSFLRWMVPEHVAEVWEVDIPLAMAKRYFPALHQRIAAECERFESVHVSLARSHPADFNITSFTGVPRHDFALPDYRITFIWRADRPWIGNGLVVRVLRKLGMRALFLGHQRRKVCKLFSRLKRTFPKARFTVAGLGREVDFPSWIDDHRSTRFDADTERGACRVYSESRIVIGVHGSNMLLPSAHTGMAIDLMPDERWSNIAQDILYHQQDFAGDQRVAAFRFRYVPIEAPLPAMEKMIVSMIRSFAEITEAFSG